MTDPLSPSAAPPEPTPAATDFKDLLNAFERALSNFPSKEYGPARQAVEDYVAGLEGERDSARESCKMWNLCLEQAEAANSSALDEHLRYVLKSEAEMGRISNGRDAGDLRLEGILAEAGIVLAKSSENFEATHLRPPRTGMLAGMPKCQRCGVTLGSLKSARTACIESPASPLPDTPGVSEMLDEWERTISNSFSVEMRLTKERREESREARVVARTSLEDYFRTLQRENERLREQAIIGADALGRNGEAIFDLQAQRAALLSDNERLRAERFEAAKIISGCERCTIALQEARIDERLRSLSDETPK